MDNDISYFNIRRTNLSCYLNNNADLDVNSNDRDVYNCICQDIDTLFRFFNITPGKCGYLYWQDAAFLYLLSKEVKPSMCKEIYPSIAKKYARSEASIDRAMNRCFENVLYNLSKKEDNFIKSYFNNSVLHPKNSEILARIVEVIISSRFQDSKIMLNK